MSFQRSSCTETAISWHQVRMEKLDAASCEKFLTNETRIITSESTLFKQLLTSKADSSLKKTRTSYYAY